MSKLLSLEMSSLDFPTKEFLYYSIVKWNKIHEASYYNNPKEYFYFMIDKAYIHIYANGFLNITRFYDSIG